MQIKYKISLVFIMLLGVNLPLQAHTSGYWTNSSGQMVRNGSGECWRTIDWTKSLATAECEGGMKAMPEKDSDKDGVVDSKDQCPGTAPGLKVNMSGCVNDTDGDGAADSYDKCPGTPKGIKVDATGCPLDSDGDGAADSYDRCPNTPKGINVDATGCPADSDGDGAADSYDKCPGTPKGVSVDATGCAVSMDDDNDGIMNANDECAGTAAGTAVNKRGCALKADKIALDNVQFKTGTSVLSASSRETLDKVAKTLKENPHLKFEIAGHTDSSGSYQANVDLSESRAQAVRQYLVDSGVGAERLTAHGYGPDKPVASNDTRSGRSANRRVELMLK